MAPDARRWELGSLNYAGIYGLSASLDMILSVGTEAIEIRVRALADYLCEAARQAGLEVMDVRSPHLHSSGIVSLEIDEAPRVVAELARLGINVSARRGLLRVSLHLYNDESDIDALLAGLRQLS